MIDGFTVNYWIDKNNSNSTHRSFLFNAHDWKHRRDLDAIVVVEKVSCRVVLYIPYESLISIVGFCNEEGK